MRERMSLGKILVVDDDRNLIELVKMRLESENYEVVATLKEEEAIEAVKSQTFDLSIVDLQLVHKDGISLMEEFHGDRSSKGKNSITAASMV
jgi:two-component system response regulator GlrR